MGYNREAQNLTFDGKMRSIIIENAMENQIKSKKRVSDFGEVYTNEREVNAMLDLVKEETEKITSTFLEPACGNGNFLVEILRRKLTSVARIYGSDMSEYRLHMIEAVTSIYGVDIQADNVQESRRRLLDMCREEFSGSYGINLSDGTIKALECVMKRNIICGNTLTCLADDGSPLVFSEWKLNENGMFERQDFLLSDMLDNKESSLSDRPIIYDWRAVA